jgi:hypothetical protein
MRQYIDLLTDSEVQELLRARSEPGISIYLPAGGKAERRPQARIRLKDLLKTAAEDLNRYGVERGQAEILLQPARKLLDDLMFWEFQAGGLAVLLDRTGCRAVRLEHPVSELVVVGPRFHLAPLLTRNLLLRGFYLLDLGEHEFALYQGSAVQIEETGISGTAVEAMGAWRDVERRLQYHSGDRIGRRGPVIGFHGHGLGKDRQKAVLMEKLRAMDDFISNRLSARAKLPMIVVGAEPTLSLFAQISRYPEVIVETAEGAGSERLHSLWRKGLAVLKQREEQAVKKAQEKFMEARGTGQGVSELALVLRAAEAGAVDTLFVPLAEHRWGEYLPGEGRIKVWPEKTPGVCDLYDLAAAEVVLHDGIVYELSGNEFGGQTECAAILRYPFTFPQAAAG